MRSVHKRFGKPQKDTSPWFELLDGLNNCSRAPTFEQEDLPRANFPCVNVASVSNQNSFQLFQDVCHRQKHLLVFSYYQGVGRDVNLIKLNFLIRRFCGSGMSTDGGLQGKPVMMIFLYRTFWQKWNGWSSCRKISEQFTKTLTWLKEKKGSGNHV